MRYWFDTEFIEDGHSIDLISIGIVSEDGRAYYAECRECDLSGANDWVRQNVIPHLIHETKPRIMIAAEIRFFLGNGPEIWGYYADYDWVAFCQLYGRMIDLPRGWPRYCRDVKQWADLFGDPQLPPQEGPQHHALADARWTKQAWEFLKEHAGNEHSNQNHGHPRS